MPKPKQGETEDQFVERCIPFVLNEGTAKDEKQAVAICHSIWREEKKAMDPNEELLVAIRQRQEKQTRFNRGILTADRYVQTMLDKAGVEICYGVAAKGMTSFDDVLRKAAQTLVYSNEDSEVHEKLTDLYNDLPQGVELPKSTLMVFRHTLSTPRKDRDGDILRTEGMEVDPKMLLLFQHVNTMPIGKMLRIALQNEKTLDLWSCIIDMNETSHDSAVMVDNGMGRFSHGFKAREFDKVKDSKGKLTGGFDIVRCEVMEESLVSVPANVDTDTHEVILSLVESGKLTSSVMKEVGRVIREGRDVTVPVKMELEESNEKGDSDTDTASQFGGGDSGGDDQKAGGEASPSKEASDGTGDEGSEGRDEGERSTDKEVKKEEEKEAPVCPKCGSDQIKDGVCEKCGYKMTGKEKPSKAEEPEKEEEEEKTSEADGEKKGRVLSLSNEGRLKKAVGYAEEAYKMSPPIDCKACIGQSIYHMKGVLSTMVNEEGKEVEGVEEKSEELSMEEWVAHSTKAERARLVKVLKHFDEREEASKKAEQYRELKRQKTK